MINEFNFNVDYSYKYIQLITNNQFVLTQVVLALISQMMKYRLALALVGLILLRDFFAIYSSCRRRKKNKKKHTHTPHTHSLLHIRFPSQWMLERPGASSQTPRIADVWRIDATGLNSQRSFLRISKKCACEEQDVLQSSATEETGDAEVTSCFAFYHWSVNFE